MVGRRCNWSTWCASTERQRPPVSTPPSDRHTRLISLGLCVFGKARRYGDMVGLVAHGRMRSSSPASKSPRQMAHAVISEGSRPSNSGMAVSFPSYLTTCSDMVAIASQPQQARVRISQASALPEHTRVTHATATVGQATLLTGSDEIARATSRRSAPATRSILQKERMR